MHLILFIQGDLNLEFEPLLVGIGGKHTFTLRSVYQKQIQPQKLLRKFPLILRENDGQDTTTETVGMMINGVEIKNYKSQDKIYSGSFKFCNFLKFRNWIRCDKSTSH